MESNKNHITSIQSKETDQYTSFFGERKTSITEIYNRNSNVNDILKDMNDKLMKNIFRNSERNSKTLNKSELMFKEIKNSNNLSSFYNPQNRKYSKDNLEKGKNFFLFRYLLTQLEIESQFQEINPKKREEEKVILKYSNWFDKKSEKAVFSFNIKEIEKCYQELYTSKIIENKEEFAEFLLVFSGFDKYIIGEFLSKDKEKGLNENLSILKTYMKKIDFSLMPFLDAMRFLFTRINLPKDANLVLIIIDEFTQAYYKYNSPSPNYKDSNALYLLSSTILAVNTMLSRTDIKNIVVMKKEDFIKMNKDCSEEFSGRIYDDLRKNKIELTNDYKEIIYNRLVMQEKGLKQYTTSFINKQSDEESQEYIKLLKSGQSFLKFGNYSRPHERFFHLTNDEKYLKWAKLSGCRACNENSVNVDDIKDILIGSAASDVFRKAKIPLNYDRNCFSIFTNKRTIDLKNEDEGITRRWFFALSFLIRRNKEIGTVKSKLFLDDNTKDELWRTEILLKWEIYRKFIFSYENFFDEEEMKAKIKDISMFERKKASYANTSEKNIFDKYEFYSIWYYGLPKWLRVNTWTVLIQNKSYITENLFKFYSEKVKMEFDFHALDAQYKEINQNNSDHKKLINLDDEYSTKIINDILKVVNKNEFLIEEIKENNLSKEDFMKNLYLILRVFLLYRCDFNYSTPLVYLISIFLLNSENYFEAFINFVNFLIPSPFAKILKGDEFFILRHYKLFQMLIDNYIPNLSEHFKHLNITVDLFIDRWFKTGYIKFFKYEALLRLWDIYLIKGEVFLYEIGVAILKMQENSLMNLTKSYVIDNLKKFPKKYFYVDFFKVLGKIEIYQIVKKERHDAIVGTEKITLMEALLNDDL